uniref:Golgi apparatus protein 1 n=1 Tax=Parascaris univalens TaxID=6257 RepID=A0A915AS27_PARUN
MRLQECTELQARTMNLLWQLGVVLLQMCTYRFVWAQDEGNQVQPPQKQVVAAAPAVEAPVPNQLPILQDNNIVQPIGHQPPERGNAGGAQPNAAGGEQAAYGDKLLIEYDECKEDVHKYCQRDGVDLRSDMAVLECLQNAGLSETVALSGPCENLIWQFKVNLTQDDRFRYAAQQFCADEMAANRQMATCIEDKRPGYSLSCLLDYIHNMSRSSRCFRFLENSERLAFSDFRVVGPFVALCGEAIKRLQCGSLTAPSAHQKVRVPHSQGATLECLIDKIVKASQTDPGAMQMIDDKCKHEVMRIAELQSDDFHLDRQLFFACREDRERFCKDVQSGNGKVFECLMNHRNDQFMEPACAQILGERAALLGQNFRLSHPLVDGCAAELGMYKCSPQAQFAASPNFHLSWVLLCLENAARSKDAKFSEQCQHEMLEHRRMMMSEFRMSPEVVLTCGQDIDRYCSPKGDIEGEGRTLHCLMGHAQQRADSQKLTPQCMQALATVVKLADIGSNYKVDRVLYASCQKLIDGPCAMDAQSEASTLTCLMRHMDADMPKECEQRLLEVQYFMARDWTLDPELYQACHEDAVQKCSANEQWHLQKNIDNRPEAGPVVLACLYRAAYDDQNPLKPECAANVRRVLRTRAVRVNLIPDIEDACRDALSEYCSNDVKPMEEMRCLQDHFEEKEFMSKHRRCYEELSEFTKMEVKDTALNRALTKACKPVISTYCSQFMNEEIDHGDVMECLLSNKDRPEMTPKCRSYVNHFELISLRDYTFSYRFKQACANDVNKYCQGMGNEKAQIIRCLSTVMFEHRVLGSPADLEKDCKKQLKVAYLQQEQVNFDDQDHMKDADPTLMSKCKEEVMHLKCNQEKSFEDIVECLRTNFDELGPECKAVVFTREKVEAMDNRFDDELQRQCRVDIDRYCHNQEGEKVLECLMNSKIVRILSPKCQKVVVERMHEQARDVRLNPSLLDACREEAEKYCPEDYKKINDPQYAKKTLEGVFMACLRTQYADPRKGVLLKPKCKDEIAKVVLESEFDVQLDPLLYRACKETISKHCANKVIAGGGSFDSVLECLKTDYSHGAIPNGDCARQIARRLQESLVDLHLDPLLHEACASDVQRLCRGVPPGQSRLVICLMDAMKNPSTRMSPTCRNKLVERNELWMRAHNEHALMMPESFADVVQIVSVHPQRTSLLMWFAGFVFVLLAVGCCCGRATKRIKRELKNR